MRSLTLAVVATVLVSVLAVPEPEMKRSFLIKSFLDPIIKGILEKMRPKFADLKIGGMNEIVRNPNMNATFYIDDIVIKNLDKFVNKELQTKVVPLKLLNLTLTWKDVIATAVYDIDAVFNVPKFEGPFRIHGKGDFRLILNDLFFTTGANLEMKNGAVQIKPRGIFGFDMSIQSTRVTFSSVMGSKDFGEALGTFLSKIIPDVVNILKNPVFNSFQDDIIRVVNEVLKGEKKDITDTLASDIWNELFHRMELAEGSD